MDGESMGGRGASIGIGAGVGAGGIILVAPDGVPLENEFLKGMEDTLNKEGTKLAKRAYAEMLPELKYGGKDAINPSQAYYSRITKRSFFDQDRVANPKKYKIDHYRVPYETAFHEFAHAMDHRISRSNSEYASYDIHTNLKKILKDDYKAFKKKMGFKNNNDAFNYFNTKYDLRTRGSLSDTLEGVTKRKFPLGMGHGVSYHNNPGASETEFFAEVMASSASNKGSYNLLKEVFPNGVKIVENIVEAELKKRGK